MTGGPASDAVASRAATQTSGLQTPDPLVPPSRQFVHFERSLWGPGFQLREQLAHRANLTDCRVHLSERHLFLDNQVHIGNGYAGEITQYAKGAASQNSSVKFDFGHARPGNERALTSVLEFEDTLLSNLDCLPRLSLEDPKYSSIPNPDQCDRY